MPKEYFKKKGQSNSFKMSNPYGPLKHLVRDNPEHQDTYGDHSDDLQTDSEHDASKGGDEGTRTHWPDGTKRTEREMFEYDETKTEEGKDTPLEQLDPTTDPSIMSNQGTVGTLGGAMNDPAMNDPVLMYKKKEAVAKSVKPGEGTHEDHHKKNLKYRTKKPRL